MGMLWIFSSRYKTQPSSCFSIYSFIKDTMQTFSHFKNKEKREWSNDFWYVKEYKTNAKKNSLRTKQTVQKIRSFFLSRAPTHHCFLHRFLNELKNKVSFSKTVGLMYKISIFDSVLFWLKFIFLFNKMDSLTLKSHNSFQN